jgi:hypothetical protein
MQYCFYLVLLLFLFGLITVLFGPIPVPVIFFGLIPVPVIFFGLIPVPVIFFGLVTTPIKRGLVTTPLFVFGLVTVLRFWSYYDPPIFGLITRPQINSCHIDERYIRASLAGKNNLSNGPKKSS